MASLADPLAVLETYNPESPRPGIRAWSAGVVRYKYGSSVSGRKDVCQDLRSRAWGPSKFPRTRDWFWRSKRMPGWISCTAVVLTPGGAGIADRELHRPRRSWSASR